MPTWIRVRDDTTGAHFDVDRRSLRKGMTPIEGYPELSGPHARPRPTKYPALPPAQPAEAGQSATPEPPATDDPAKPADTTEE